MKRQIVLLAGVVWMATACHTAISSTQTGPLTPGQIAELWYAPRPRSSPRGSCGVPGIISHGLESVDTWSSYRNPCVGTKELNGLLVLQLMLGNSDLKDEQNAIYPLTEPFAGSFAGSNRRSRKGWHSDDDRTNS